MIRLSHLPFVLVTLVMACANKSQVIEEVFALPKHLDESSAVEVTPKSDWIWTLEDSGNAPELYALDKSGTVKNTLAITNAKNNDWEDLTSDAEGNLYIGDFGNNDNDRQNLAIYKVNAADLKNKTTAITKKISFYYPEQKDFPPKKSKHIFDAESFFYYQNNFYIFTKNRSSKFNGRTTLYQVPDQEGNHAAKLIATFDTCDAFSHCAVTSADISPDGKKVVLLTSTYVWIFTEFTGNNFFNGKSQQIDLESFTQKEGICFTDNNNLFITDERKKKSGGYLYHLDLTKLKGKS